MPARVWRVRFADASESHCQSMLDDLTRAWLSGAVQPKTVREPAVKRFDLHSTRGRRRLVVAVVVLALVSSACHRHASWENNSYYVGSTSQDKISSLGCQNGNKQGRMTLFFGAPTRVGDSYGTSMWAAKKQTTHTIQVLVKQFIRGYVWCRDSSRYQLMVGIGTSNSAIDNKSAAWIERHGRRWAAAAKAVSDWADRHYPGIVRVYGAWDAEPSWSTYGNAARWMKGYQSLPGHRPLYANFSADGCSWTSANNASCNNGWTQRHVWDLAWERPPSMPIPQIYANSGVNARQWQKISEYGASRHNRPLTFFGTMTQQGACSQVGGCSGINNSPHAARDQMIRALNQNRLTRQAEIESTTDMRWHA
jgi:hypothetical protein